MLFLLAGCEKSPEIPPIPKSGVNIATAEDCAAILQDVRAGRDVIINIRCDLPTEAKLIAAIAQGAWTATNPYSMPTLGWQAKADEANGTFVIIPTPGSYWSQYDFRIDVTPYGLSQFEFAYVNAYNADDIARLIPSFDSMSIAKIAAIRIMYPVLFGEISEEAQELLMSDSDAPLAEMNAAIQKKIIDHLPIRRDVQYEDGSSVENLRLSVRRDNERVSVGVTLLPFIEAYPSWPEPGEAHPAATRISCSANKEVRLKSFKAICTIFLERQALAQDEVASEVDQSAVDPLPEQEHPR